MISVSELGSLRWKGEGRYKRNRKSENGASKGMTGDLSRR